jgi:hypothetical protein
MPEDGGLATSFVGNKRRGKITYKFGIFFTQ